MKKLIITLLIAVLGVVAFAAPVFAQASGNPLDATCAEEGAADSAVCRDNAANTGDNPVSGSSGIVLKIIHIIQIVAGVAGVIMIIIGGLEYVMSAGDSAKLNTAKNTILFAVIGLVITIVAQLIIVFVVRRL